MANKKITRLGDLNQQIDGKLEVSDNDGNFVPSTLDQLLGQKLGKYAGVTLEEYQNDIKSKNLAELQTHAINLGLVPNRDRDRLTKQLIAAFNKYNSSYKKPAHVDSNVKLSETKSGRKTLENALKIMSGVK